MKGLRYIIYTIIFFQNISAQKNDAVIFKDHSAYTSFPDTGRTKGHFYNGTNYSMEEHYNDNSIRMIVPSGFHTNKKVNFIFWFHGWNNNIDTAIEFYRLKQQFEQSGINAIMVLAETAKDAPDSYGGKLENKGVFNELLHDVLLKLKKLKQLKSNAKADKIILAGHSGAYRVIANILANGKTNIDEVILFDALYADTDKYINWIKQNSNHKFINLYTNFGGTDEETGNMKKLLNEQKIVFKSIEETELSPTGLKSSNILFIHSLHQHNDIIFNPDNFKLFLKNSVINTH